MSTAEVPDTPEGAAFEFRGALMNTIASRFSAAAVA
jgi:hypothetical protein